MKYSKKVFLLVAAILLFVQAGALADDAKTQPQTTPEATVEISADAEISITPDSVLYPIKIMLENLSISFTFDENNKAELLIKYANRRIAEAEIMKSEDNQELTRELVEASLELIEKANKHLETNDETSEHVDGIIVELSEVQDEVVISLEALLEDGMNPEDFEKLAEKAEEAVVKTLVTNAFLVSKDNFFDAKDDFFDARDELKAARESGDEKAIEAAYAKFLAAEELKDQLEDVKDEFEDFKDQVKDNYDDNDKDDDDDDEDEDNEDGEGMGKGLDKNKDKIDNDDLDNDDDNGDENDDDDRDKPEKEDKENNGLAKGKDKKDD